MTTDIRPLYAIGDVQGCCEELQALLAQAALRDARLWFAGDLVNRGPASLETLRLVKSLGNRAQCVLGNHDLHLLAVAAGVRKPGKRDTLDAILRAPDRDDLLEWLRHQPLALHDNGFLMVHAGVLPSWTLAQTLTLAGELEMALRGPDWREFLTGAFGNHPPQWRDDLTGSARLRVALNGLTRLRFCTPDGAMEFGSTAGPADAPPGYLPWFDVPDRQTQDSTVVFGHWSALGLLQRERLIGLDTGCVWGGQLSAVRLVTDPGERIVKRQICVSTPTV